MKNKKAKNILIVSITLAVLIGATVALILATRKPPDKVNPAQCSHNFEETESVAASEFAPGTITSQCSLCGEEKTERQYATGELPQIYFDGALEGIGKDSAVPMKAEYIDSDQTFTSFATIKYQGHTAMNYDKKNFTLKFFNNENGKDKNKVALHGWEKSSKYCLKANYIDFSQSRNVVSNNIWSEVVYSRKNLDSNIADLPFKGAIDGYPVMVFINNIYQGVYTMNIPKDDDTYNIGNDKGEALFVINSPSSDSAHFKSNLTEEDKKTIFDLEYCYGDDDTWAYDSLDNLIDFVIKNDSENFKNGIGKYLDVDAAIDYLITTYYLGLTDNFAKNVLLITYDGEKWIPSLYDLDTAGGLAFDGSKIYGTDYLLPQKNADGTLDSSSDSLLWDRILNNYTAEIKARYQELRKGALDTEKTISQFETFISGIPGEYYDKDLEIWGDIPLHDKNNFEQIKSYLSERSGLLDKFFDSL